MTASRTLSASTLAFFAASLLLASVLSTPATARNRAPAHALAQVAPLTVIHTGADTTVQPGDTHRPGLPEVGKLRVYWFWSGRSPCTKNTERAARELVEQFPDVELFIVHANADETVEQARRIARERGFALPIYRDERAALAIALDARATPQAFVLDHEGVVYQGRSEANGRGGALENYVADAVARKLAGEPVKPATRRPVGCALTRP